jgi:hypothetical protein
VSSTKKAIDSFFDREDVFSDLSGADREAWHKDYPDVDPQEVVDAIFGKGSTITGLTVGYSEDTGGMTISGGRGSMVHGSEVEMVIRTFSKSTATVSHDYLKLRDEAARGAGTVKKMFAESIPVYQKMGMKKVEVHANLDAGGYAWGRYGFNDSNPDVQDGPRRSLASRFGGRMEVQLYKMFGEAIPDSAKDEIASLKKLHDLHKTNPNFPALITSAKTPELTKLLHSSGKARRTKSSFVSDTLFNADWYGELDMTSPPQMGHLSEYVGSKLPVAKS